MTIGEAQVPIIKSLTGNSASYFDELPGERAFSGLATKALQGYRREKNSRLASSGHEQA